MSFIGETSEPPSKTMTHDALMNLIGATLRQQSGTDDTHLYGVLAATERRRNTVNRLLEAARETIAEDGIAALTFRKLSGRCDIGLSNLQYYFPSSQKLIQALLRYILSNYLLELLDGEFLYLSDPRARLRAYFCFQAQDVQRKRTNALFSALWDLAQRDRFVAEKMEEL